MVAPISIETARTRRRLRQAELAVREMRDRLSERGGKLDFNLIRDIRAAEIRAMAAREALRRLIECRLGRLQPPLTLQ